MVQISVLGEQKCINPERRGATHKFSIADHFSRRRWASLVKRWLADGFKLVHLRGFQAFLQVELRMYSKRKEKHEAIDKDNPNGNGLFNLQHKSIYSIVS